MSDTLTCPSCHAEIEITEALSRQLSDQLRKQFEAEQRKREKEFADREAKLAQLERALTETRQTLDAQREAQAEEVQRLLIAERAKLQKAAEEAAVQKARADFAVETALREAELKDLRSKNAEFQQREIELLKERRRLDDEKREFELKISRQLDEERIKIREQTLREADEDRRLKDAEKDKIIQDMKDQIAELKRKSEQGSQQLQGEVLELSLEDMLRRHFPSDNIIPVPKGVYGGDVLQEVFNSDGQACGAILWESKRTKNWSDGWLPKLRDDQRAAKAQIAILVSIELPKGTTTFNCHDGVWVTNFACALSLASALRSGLIEVACAKQAMNGQQGKMEMLYAYLSGTEFRNRIEGIVEAFSTLKDDLEKEKRAIQTQWNKREKQLERAIAQASGMYGDLQGIIGRSLPAIDALALPDATDDGDQRTLAMR